MTSLVFVTFFISFLMLSTFSSSQSSNKDIPPFIKFLPNGTIVRDTSAPFKLVPPQPIPDPATKVVSKDITLNSFKNITARLYLPSFARHSSNKLPILIYFHGGGFCIGSAFTKLDHLFMNRLTSKGRMVSISINYRLFPEFPLPTAFNDAWHALQWVVSQSHTVSSTEPWLASHGDFSKVFIGGDSAGGTIVHNLAMRASLEPLLYHVHIYGAILAMPHFIGSVRVPHEPKNITLTSFYRIWDYVCPRCPHGVDNPAINPEGPRSPTLRRLAVEKLLVYTAENDLMLWRDIEYLKAIRGSKWKGTLVYYEGKNVTHAFHIMNPEISETHLLIDRLARFIQY